MKELFQHAAITDGITVRVERDDSTLRVTLQYFIRRNQERQIAQFKACAAVRGRSFGLTTVNVCGPSSAAVLMTCSVPPEATV